MAIVLKGNRQLTIEEHKVEDYVAQGYDYIDKCGNVLTKGDPITFRHYAFCTLVASTCGVADLRVARLKICFQT